jgi:hypothetical protein
MTRASLRPLTRFATLAIVGLLGLGTAWAEANGSGVAVPPVPSFPKQDPARYGRALADYAETFDTGWVDQYSKSRMTLIDSRGDKVERAVTQMTLEGPDGNKSLSRFMSPADIRGVAALVHEHPKATDDTWLYLPASRRVRRISGANRTASFQGTEFTYEDLSRVEPERYDWKFLEETTLKTDGRSEPVYVLEAIPRYSDTAYSRLRTYMNRTLWRVERVEFFDKAGKALKTLTFSDWKLMHGRFWRAHKLDMDNVQTKKRTVMQIDSLFLNLHLYKRDDGSPRENLNESQFTQRALENG